MASCKLLNLSATFLCSCRISSSSSSRRLFAFSTFSPLTKSQPFPRFCTSASAATAVDSTSAVLSDQEEAPLAEGHPWPEWDSFLEKLRSKGYFERGRSIEEFEAEGETTVGAVEDATMETNRVKNACLKFGRERFDILSSLPMQDLRAVVECGCPSLFRKAVNSSKRLRAFLQIDEGDACGVCKLRGSCDRAYVAPKDEQGSARTVDVIRVLLTYALEPGNLSGGESFVQANVQESARSLLAELIKLSDTMIDPFLPRPVFHNAPITKGKAREPMTKSFRSGQSSGVEMKIGDWLCPKCNFHNFSRNMRCFRCNEDGSSLVRPSELDMRPGDWSCPKCQYMNFARNRACLRCEEPHKRELNFGEWECPSCYYVNFRRNQECRKCNCQRPEEADGGQFIDRPWQRLKERSRDSTSKFGDDLGWINVGDNNVSSFDGYRNLQSEKRR
ncbi:zinc finger (Ran-binding) family protein [Rhynchospora pubera]|uniref:Zinc finger (Ran-binding) family protein n=1 Tax=Rhynchospora pubera TaxID=906938 RepID=A0AAV8D5G7_9POAL|nr:zinc finger (Ran-binding) family protein [Rhynchospora pubera]